MGNPLPQCDRPGETLPNGQIVDNSTGLVETLEAVKKKYDAALEEGKTGGNRLRHEECRCRCRYPGYRPRETRI